LEKIMENLKNLPKETTTPAETPAVPLTPVPATKTPSQPSITPVENLSSAVPAASAKPAEGDNKTIKEPLLTDADIAKLNANLNKTNTGVTPQASNAAPQVSTSTGPLNASVASADNAVVKSVETSNAGPAQEPYTEDMGTRKMFEAVQRAKRLREGTASEEDWNYVPVVRANRTQEEIENDETIALNDSVQAEERKRLGIKKPNPAS